MAAGGTFEKYIQKERPGTYINVQSDRAPKTDQGYSGIVLMPLINHNYGPDREAFTIDSADRNGQFAKLGYDLTYENEYTVPLRLALMNAKQVICYNVNNNGAKATAAGENEGDLSATAKYAGTRGNDLKYSIVANPSGGFDVTVYLADEAVERLEGLATIGELIDAGSEWITFEGTAETALTANTGVALTGGTNGTVANLDIVKFLDWSESQKWNTLVFPVDGTAGETETEKAASKSLLETVCSKIQYLRDQCGKYRRAAVGPYAANYEAITSPKNGFVLESGYVVDAAQATAWLGGLDSASDKTQSNTGAVVPGAVALDVPLTHAEICAAILDGYAVFTLDDDNQVILEYDINTLTDFSAPKDSSYRKNRVIRTFDSLCDEIKRTCKPNKYANNDMGIALLEKDGQIILSNYERDGALKNVDTDADLVVDREHTKDDYAYIDMAAQSVDSLEKLHFSLHTS